MRSLPSLDHKDEFQTIKDLPPSLLDPPPGCIFHPRCPYVMERCMTETPILKRAGKDLRAACHFGRYEIGRCHDRSAGGTARKQGFGGGMFQKYHQSPRCKTSR